jgi:DNA repair protein RAD50
MRFSLEHEVDRYQELDVQILEGQGPIDLLDREHQSAQTELNTKLSQAQQVTQELSRSTDKLEGANKHIER